MTSSPQHVTPESVQEESILLERISIKVTLKHFCDNFTFFLVTALIICDLVTDIWVIITFGCRRDTVFMGVMTGLLLFGSLVVAVAHSAQHRSDTERRARSSYANLCLNFPLQLAVLYQRCVHGAGKCRQCCPKQISGQAHGPRGKPVNADWQFAKLKLTQSMFHCVPQLVGNLLHMLVYKRWSLLQVVSAVTSFVSILFGVVLHEKARKEQTRGALLGLAKVFCILAYKGLVMGTRLLAVVHFIYYFGGWMAALLVPHVLVLLAFYLYLYRQVWKVQYHTIVEHSLYSVLAYFPIHSEYRPEGEIVLFYVLFMVENIAMVALPFKVSPTMSISRPFHPTSRYYFVVMLTVLVGSTAGLVFMCAYYFLLHKSRHSIRDTHLGWLASLCEWRRQEPHQVTVAIPNGSGAPGLRVLVAADGARPDDGEPAPRVLPPDGQRGFHSRDDGSGLSRQLTDADVDASLLNANVVKFVTSAPNPESGSQSERLLIQGDVHQDTANRPSVLEGDDDDDDDDDDQRHIIV